MAKVLLADDEPVARKLVSRLIRMAGHEVTVVEDGLAALSLMESQEYDVLVSDMNMPGMDGVELIQSAAIVSPYTEVIVLTGHIHVGHEHIVFLALHQR